MAKSGVAAALLLNKLGSKVTLYDSFNTQLPEGLQTLNLEFCYESQLNKELKKFDAIVLSPGIPYNSLFLEEAKKLGIYIIGEFELGCQFYQGPIYAITGTNGKTTTTMLAAHILKYIGKVEMAGNIGLPLSSLSSYDMCVAEVSSFQLESIHTFHPKIAVVLNLSEDHLDRHITMENYGAIKERIFMNQNKNDYVILNYDNPYTKDMAKRAKSKVIFFSINEELKNGVYFKNNEIIVNVQNKTVSIKVNKFKLLGLHNLENAMVAIIISIIVGADKYIIEKAIATFNPIDHRLEYVITINNVHFYNDSKATNPESSIKSIVSVKGSIVLIAGGRPKDADYTNWVKTFNGKVKSLIVIGEARKKIIDTCKFVGYTNFIEANSLESAVNIAYSLSTKGDTVLFSPACSSFDMFKDFELRGQIFKNIVKNL